MRAEMAVNSDVIEYFLESINDTDCNEIGKEIMTIAKLDAIVRVGKITVAQGSSKASALQAFCKSFEDYPIIMIAGGNVPEGVNPIVSKYTDMMAADLAGFTSLQNVIEENDVTVMAYYKSDASRDFIRRIDAYAAAIRMSGILHDKIATEIFRDEVVGWKGAADDIIALFSQENEQDNGVKKVKSF